MTSLIRSTIKYQETVIRFGILKRYKKLKKKAKTVISGDSIYFIVFVTLNYGLIFKIKNVGLK